MVKEPEWGVMAVFLHVVDKCGLKTICKVTGASRTSVRRFLKEQGCYMPGRSSKRPRFFTPARVKPTRIKASLAELEARRRARYQSDLTSGVFKRRSILYYRSNKSDIYARIKSDPNRLLRLRYRNRITKAMRRAGHRKSCSTTQLLGCSFPELKLHLEIRFRPGMTWENYGQWHIDHIIPCAAFDLTDENQRRQCFHYTNLQPLWAQENRSKHARTGATPRVKKSIKGHVPEEGPNQARTHTPNRHF